MGGDGGRRRRRGRCARARRAVAGGADAAVPRHPPGLVDRLGARRGRGGVRPCRRRAGGAHRRTGSARWRRAARSPPTRPRSTAARSSCRRRRRRATARPSSSPTAASRRSCAVPGLGLGPLVASPLPAGSGGRASHVVVTDRSMSNGRLAVGWDLDGKLTSVIDVARGRELLPAGGAGAVLLLAVDRPVRYDAWDLESWTVAGGVPVGAPESIDVEAAGPLVGIVAVRRSFGPSTAVVRYVLRAGVAAPRRRHRARLAPRRAPAVDALPARRARRHRDVRRAVRGGAAADARLDVVGRRQVRGVRPPLRRRRRAGLRRRRAQRRSLRPRRCSTAPCGSAWRGRPSTPIPTPTRAATTSRWHCSRTGRGSPTSSPRPSGSTCRCGSSNVLRRRRRRGGCGLPAPVVSVTGRGVEVDAVKVADDGSGDIVVRLHEATGTGWQRRSPSPDASPPPPAATCSRSRSVTSRCPTASSPSRCARSSW